MTEEFCGVAVRHEQESPPEQGILSCRLLFVVRAGWWAPSFLLSLWEPRGEVVNVLEQSETRGRRLKDPLGIEDKSE